MALITLTFSREMQRAIFEGRKCCTTRSEPKGKIGDTFTLLNRTYQIVDIRRQSLAYVAEFLYRQEGFDSPEAFTAFLTQLHPGGFSLTWGYYVHWFARVEDTEADLRKALSRHRVELHCPTCKNVIWHNVDTLSEANDLIGSLCVQIMVYGLLCPGCLQPYRDPLISIREPRSEDGGGSA